MGLQDGHYSSKDTNILGKSNTFVTDRPWYEGIKTISINEGEKELVARHKLSEQTFVLFYILIVSYT